MADFGQMTLTAAGISLCNKAQTGVPIDFTKMKTGNDGTLEDVTISSIGVAGNIAQIKGTITNSGRVTAFYVNKLQLFATDPDDGEILYASADAGESGDYIPPESSGPFTREFTINIAIGNASNVTATIPQETFATVEQLNDLAGAGRTTETVKGNADAIIAHETDSAAQNVGGTGTAITITLQSFAAYTDNYMLTFLAGANNGGAATTINVNGLGAKPLYKPNTTTAPNLIAGKAYTVWYDTAGTGSFFIKASAEGTAVAGDVLAGKTFSNDDDTGIVGTMPNNGALGTYTPTTVNQNIPAGYTSGGTVAGDPDLVSANIKAGANIFGVVGNANVVDTSPGTAVAADILSGKIAFVDGAQLTGTMPNRSGDTAALASSVVGTTLKLRASNGYRDGVDDNVTITDADFIAANIKSGIDIFGISGSLIEKKFANGTATSGSTSTALTMEGGGSNNAYLLTVSGLSFTPRMIYCTRNDGISKKAATSANTDAPKESGIYNLALAYSAGFTHEAWRIVSPLSIASGGFTLPVPYASLLYSWWAIE